MCSALHNIYIPDNNPTRGVDFYKFQNNFLGENIEICFYDTSGQELYGKFRKIISEDAKAIMLLYNSSSRYSFMHICETIKNTPWSDAPNVQGSFFIIAINSTNDKVEVPSSEGKNLASSNNMIFLEATPSFPQTCRYVIDKIGDHLASKLLKDDISNDFVISNVQNLEDNDNTYQRNSYCSIE